MARIHDNLQNVTGQQGPSVFVVTDSARVALRSVTVARTTDSLAVLSAGVTAGERVVVAGQVRITDGAPVKVVAAERATVAP